MVYNRDRNKRVKHDSQLISLQPVVRIKACVAYGFNTA